MSAAGPTRELIPPEIDAHRVAWLMTDDGGGTTLTRVRFSTDGGKLYVTLPSNSVVLQQIRRCPEVLLSLGKGNDRIRGPEISARAHILRRAEWPWGRHLLARKYWLLRIARLWRQHVLIEITFT